MGQGASGGVDRTDRRDTRVETSERVHLNYRDRANAFTFREKRESSSDQIARNDILAIRFE